MLHGELRHARGDGGDGTVPSRGPRSPASGRASGGGDQPLSFRRFADVLGRLAKTDRIDAEILAQFGATIRPSATEPLSRTMAQITELAAARRQIVEHRVALEQHRSEASVELVRDQISERIAMCRRQCKELDARLLEHIRDEPQMARRYQILTSIPGMGPVVAITLLTEMQELGSASAAQIAALAGVAPMNRDSGVFRSKKAIRGGRICARNVLYMAAVVAVRWDRDFARFYDRLRRAGKPFKVAITATMRKLLVLANALLCQDRPWSPTPP